MSSMRLALKLSMDAVSSIASTNDHDKEIKKKEKDDNKKSSSTKDNDSHDTKDNKTSNKSDNKEKKEKSDKDKGDKDKGDRHEKNEKSDKKIDQKLEQGNEKSNINTNKRKRAESESDSLGQNLKSQQKRSMSLDQIDEDGETSIKEIPNKKKVVTEKSVMKSNNTEDVKKKPVNEAVKKPKIEKEVKIKANPSSENSMTTFNDTDDAAAESKTDTADAAVDMETPNEKGKAKKKKSADAELQLSVPSEAEKEETIENTPRYQSNRAAAIVAKTKLSNTGGGTRSPRADVDEEDREKEKDKKKKVDEVVPTVEEEAKYVQCDTCSKWRCLPGHVDMDSLPDQWYCEMNIWDEAANNCDAPETSANDYSGDSDGRDNDYSSDNTKRKGRWAGHVSKNKRQSMKTLIAEEEEAAAAVMSAKKKGSRQFAQMQQQKSNLDKVDWVQCNKCNKWRKVPLTVDIGSLPEEWFCSLNTWNPMVARCTAKEEVDSLPIEDDIDRSASKGKKTNPTNTTSVASSTGENIKKVTEWVQCERRNCKKWRKIPAHVKLESLPEKWYCEMNVWDSERGSCDDPEPADSEDEKQQIAGDRVQLLFANSKGPGALSYRRIIFGTDGKIRPAYNEKNKSVYGLFSFTEVHKQVDNEDYIEPSRRLSYWSSSAYDSNGVSQNEVQAPKKDKDKKDKDKDKEKEQEKQKVPANANISSNVKIQQEPTILLDCIRKMNGTNLGLSTNSYHGAKSLKYKDFSLFERFSHECQIIRSILLTCSNKRLSFNSLVHYIETSNFLNAHEESCRRSMNIHNIKAAVRRLELQGEVEVSLKGNGEITIQSLKPCRPTSDPLSDVKWSQKGLPLRLRKGKDNIKAFKDDLKREEDEKRRLKRRRDEEKEEREVIETKPLDEEEIKSEEVFTEEN